MCCSSWGCKELDTTERLNSTELTLVAQMVKHLPAMRETQVRSLGWEDLLEKQQPTPVLLPGESHGRRSLVGYSPWGRKESDTRVNYFSHSQIPGPDVATEALPILRCFLEDQRRGLDLI